jgi:DNA-binding protein H-NS
MQRPILTLKGKPLMTAQTAREKLAQLEAETKELTAKKNAIRAEVLAELKSDIATFGFTAAELFETPKPAKTKGTKEPKYADANGNTWAGVGKRPTWLTEAVRAGKSQADFLIKKDAKP